MAWDDQGPPWGQKRPPGPEELLANLLRKIKQMVEGGGGDGRRKSDTPTGGDGARNFGRLGLFVAILVVANLLYNSFYTIEPGEKGVVLRFGRYTRTSEPGLNFMIPLIDKVIKVDVETVRKQEFGFRTKVPGQKTLYEKRGYDMESLMLTGDKNVIDLEWIVQYKISDPVAFLFNVRNVSQSVRDVSEAAIRQVVGNRDFDYALGNRDVIERQTTRFLQKVLDKYGAGVVVLTVKLQDVNPPDAVKPAFNEVNEADQDMKRLVNEAEETYNRIIPTARGNAKKLVLEAKGYAVERVNLAKGETSRFLALLEEYQRAKEVTRRRLYLETLEAILPKVDEIYVVDENQRTLLPVLGLGTDISVPVRKQGGRP